MSRRQTGNEALQEALYRNGIRTEKQRTEFAEKVGISDRTLRRWLSYEIRMPGPYWRDRTAKKLGVDEDVLWPPAGQEQVAA